MILEYLNINSFLKFLFDLIKFAEYAGFVEIFSYQIHSFRKDTLCKQCRPNQMPQKAAFDQGLLCLIFIQP